MKSTETSLEIVDFLPLPRNLPDGTRYGMFSATTPQGLRFVLYQALRYWQGVTETETGFTRLFLKGLPPAMCRRVQRESYEFSRPPLYVRPAALEEAVYMDIHAAFPTIYRLTGWRCEYYRSHYLIPDGNPLIWPYPMEWKIGRSYVVTGCRPSQTALVVKHGKLASYRYRPARSNPSMVACVYDCLAALARLAVSALHCVYWNVDGGIMPQAAAPIFVEFARHMGLEARAKYWGEAYTYNAGCWGVGAHHTRRADEERGPARKVYRDAIFMSSSEAEWYIKNWSKHVDKIAHKLA